MKSYIIFELLRSHQHPSSAYPHMHHWLSSPAITNSVTVCPTAGHHPEGDQRPVPGRDHSRAGQPGRRDRRHHDHQAPRLRDPGRPHRRRQPTQGDQEDVQRCVAVVGLGFGGAAGCADESGDFEEGGKAVVTDLVTEDGCSIKDLPAVCLYATHAVGWS